MTLPRLKVVIDTREQLPYRFAPARVEVTRAGLASGDYSLLGFEARVAVERKTVDDFVGSITVGRERFLRELDRLRKYECAAVVIEGSLADLHEHRYRSLATTASVLGTAWALHCRYVPLVFAGSRELGVLATEGILRRWYTDEQKRLELAAATATAIPANLGRAIEVHQ